MQSVSSAVFRTDVGAVFTGGGQAKYVIGSATWARPVYRIVAIRKLQADIDIESVANYL